MGAVLGNRPILVLLLAIALLAAPLSLLAQTPRPDPQAATLNGSGESYWGPVPPAEGAPAERYEHKRSTPAWMYVLLVPYKVVSIPFWLLNTAVGGLVQATESTPALSQFLGAKLQVGSLTFGPRIQVGSLTQLGLGLDVRHNPDGPEPGNFQL